VILPLEQTEPRSDNGAGRTNRGGRRR
jgi:hypothetical protein